MVVFPDMIRGEPLMKETLLGAAREYAKARGVPLRAVSRLAYGNSTFFEQLSRGRNVSFTAAKFDTVMAWFGASTNWPAGVVAPGVVDLFAPLEKKDPAK